MYRGVFWIVEGTLLSFPFREDSIVGISKSGNTYNHQALWDAEKPCGTKVPYNYYPRGRVEITNKGKAVIYMNPHVDAHYLPRICKDFDLQEPPQIRYDYSRHYHCYLDEH